MATPVALPPQQDRRPNRLYQAAAWVAIVAGVVFIVGAIFFAGFALGGGDGGFGGHHRGHGEMSPRSAPLMPGMRPGGPMGTDRPDGPGMIGPGMRPDGPGAMGPGMRPENPPQPPPPPPTPRP